MVMKNSFLLFNSLRVTFSSNKRLLFGKSIFFQYSSEWNMNFRNNSPLKNENRFFSHVYGAKTRKRVKYCPDRTHNEAISDAVGTFDWSGYHLMRPHQHFTKDPTGWNRRENEKGNQDHSPKPILDRLAHLEEEARISNLERLNINKLNNISNDSSEFSDSLMSISSVSKKVELEKENRSDEYNTVELQNIIRQLKQVEEKIFSPRFAKRLLVVNAERKWILLDGLLVKAIAYLRVLKIDLGMDADCTKHDTTFPYLEVSFLWVILFRHLSRVLRLINQSDSENKRTKKENRILNMTTCSLLKQDIHSQTFFEMDFPNTSEQLCELSHLYLETLLYPLLHYSDRDQLLSNSGSTLKLDDLCKIFPPIPYAAFLREAPVVNGENPDDIRYPQVSFPQNGVSTSIYPSKVSDELITYHIILGALFCHPFSHLMHKVLKQDITDPINKFYDILQVDLSRISFSVAFCWKVAGFDSFFQWNFRALLCTFPEILGHWWNIILSTPKADVPWDIVLVSAESAMKQWLSHLHLYLFKRHNSSDSNAFSGADNSKVRKNQSEEDAYREISIQLSQNQLEWPYRKSIEHDKAIERFFRKSGKPLSVSRFTKAIPFYFPKVPSGIIPPPMSSVTVSHAIQLTLTLLDSVYSSLPSVVAERIWSNLPQLIGSLFQVLEFSPNYDLDSTLVLRFAVALRQLERIKGGLLSNCLHGELRFLLLLSRLKFYSVSPLHSSHTNSEIHVLERGTSLDALETRRIIVATTSEFMLWNIEQDLLQRYHGSKIPNLKHRLQSKKIDILPESLPIELAMNEAFRLRGLILGELWKRLSISDWCRWSLVSFNKRIFHAKEQHYTFFHWAIPWSSVLGACLTLNVSSPCQSICKIWPVMFWSRGLSLRWTQKLTTSVTGDQKNAIVLSACDDSIAPMGVVWRLPPVPYDFWCKWCHEVIKHLSDLVASSANQVEGLEDILNGCWILILLRIFCFPHRLSRPQRFRPVLRYDLVDSKRPDIPEVMKWHSFMRPLSYGDVTTISTLVSHILVCKGHHESIDKLKANLLADSQLWFNYCQPFLYEASVTTVLNNFPPVLFPHEQPLRNLLVTRKFNSVCHELVDMFLDELKRVLNNYLAEERSGLIQRFP